MSQTSDRIPCPNCQASNFPASAVCWQCGRPLKASQDSQPEGQTPSQPPGEPQPPPRAEYQPQQPGAYQPPPQYTPPPRTESALVFVILGFVFAAVGFLCCPPLFGTAAIVMGALARNKRDPMGIWVIAAGIASLVIGSIIGAIVGVRAFTQGGYPWLNPR